MALPIGGSFKMNNKMNAIINLLPYISKWNITVSKSNQIF